MDRTKSPHRQFYGGIAHEYHRLRYGSRYGRLFRTLHHQVLRSILARLPSGARVLEVACGSGHGTELLQAMGLSYVACDLTPEMIAQARERLDAPAAFVLANALRLPFADGQFDAVVSTRFLHLFERGGQRQILAEMVRVLRPGGTLVVDFDNFTSRWLLAVPHLCYNLVRYRRLAPDTHYNRIAEVEQTLCGLGLRELRSTGVGGFHLALPASFSQRLAERLGAAHRTGALRCLAEQFVTTGTRIG